ncbi:MAG TPA: hypothetical protein P5256_00295 [Beijerinckiaceae bacterium]|nr:hypothetical protein [Rhodoblastus sp.]MCB1533312.1 hypothetical protein [Rhodoblastus sp.]MCC2108483.1 hypothetical protein [Hyphomicrobiales bacterium]HRY01535.1 hypothetical protein [Beijerinckiaceae bacterium]
MPNHVTHRIVITGADADIRAFVDRCIVTTHRDATEHQPAFDEQTFDFSTLIPMPEELKNVTDGSTMQWGLMLVGRADLARAYYTLENMLDWPWVKDAGVTTLDELRAYLIKTHPTIIADGEAAAARHDKYGALSWYDWSIREWGTKWSGYSYRLVSDALGRFEFMFDTAWSTPDPIWAKLAEEFPTLLFEVVGYDEGSGFAVTGEIRDGENYVECVDATDELYEATYGEPPTRYEDEDEDNDAGDHGSADTDSDAATDDEASSETV